MLKALRITGNPVVSSTRSFRKTYIAALPQLSFLDRPIFPIERVSVLAWQAGGVEAERKARKAFVTQEQEERRRSLHEFRDWQAQLRESRLKELDEERARKLLEAPPEADQEYYDESRATTIKWDECIKEGQQTKHEILSGSDTRMIPCADINLNSERDLTEDVGVKPTFQVVSNRNKRNEDDDASAGNIRNAESCHTNTLANLLETDSVIETAPEHRTQQELTIRSATTSTVKTRKHYIAPIPAKVEHLHFNNEEIKDTNAMSTPLSPPPAPFGFPTIRNRRTSVNERETWAELQQRAKNSPVRLQPPSPTSVFQQNEEQAEGSEDERVLSRAEILRELDSARQRQGVTQRFYTNFGELD